jgi:chromosome segregation ATPase
MAERAHVTSFEALEAFRATLIIYLSKARPTLEEVSSDILRIRMWLQNDQRMHWETQVRRRTKELEAAQQTLSSARVSDLRQNISTEQMAVQRARRSLDEAEAKLKRLKWWNREFDSRVQPLAKQLEKLHTVLSHDMVQAAAYLSEAVNTLAAYAEIGPAPTAPPSGEAASSATPSPAEQTK